MKLEHIALSIKDEHDINLFYKQILGMQEVRNFTLNKTLSGKIFGIATETNVHLLKKGDLTFEIFINPNQADLGFNHICFKTNDRDSLIDKAREGNYECIQIERENSDLIFIKDHSGNVFEIKNGV